MCYFFVVWHVHDIFEPKLASFHKYLSMEMMNKTECVLGICNAKCYNFLMSSVFVVWLVNDIKQLELSFFCNNIFHWKGQMGKICLQKFTTFCVDITFWYILTVNAKCCKHLTSSVFVVRFVNDIVELELSFL